MRFIRSAIVIMAILFCNSAPATPPVQPNVYEIQSITGGASCVDGYGVACTDLTYYPHIYVDGYNTPGDGGGGYFYLNGTGCSQNFGTIINDHASTPNCFYRANPTNDVREWGAKCDVVPVANVPATPTQWVSSLNAIVVPAAELQASTSAFYPKAGQFITATQIGNPPQWADRWSTLATTGTADFA